MKKILMFAQVRVLMIKEKRNDEMKVGKMKIGEKKMKSVTLQI